MNNQYFQELNEMSDDELHRIFAELAEEDILAGLNRCNEQPEDNEDSYIYASKPNTAFEARIAHNSR